MDQIIGIISDYTNWEGGVNDPPLGCLSSGCTADYGIVARPDAGMQWNADEKSSILPFICISRCKQSYKWHQGILLLAPFDNIKAFLPLL